MADCSALWPSPPCGWRGHCVAGACECDAGWALAGFETVGTDQCVRYQPVLGALYVALAVLVPPTTALYAANLLLEWRVRSGVVGPKDRVAAALIGCAFVLYFVCALRGALRRDNEIANPRLDVALLATAMSAMRGAKSIFRDRHLQCSEALGSVRPETRRLLSRLLLASIALTASQLIIVWMAASALSVVWVWRIFFITNIMIVGAELIMLVAAMIPLHAAISAIVDDMPINATGKDDSTTLVARQANTTLAARIVFLKVQAPVMVGLNALALLPGLTSAVATYGLPALVAFVMALQLVLQARQLRAHHKMIKQINNLNGHSVIRVSASSSSHGSAPPVPSPNRHHNRCSCGVSGAASTSVDRACAARGMASRGVRK
jgi:hypothetical protein